MSFLLSNDDGVHAPGLAALEAALAPLGTCWVVAPADEQSATSHTLSLRRPLRVRRHGERRFGVSGSPADAVYLGVHHLVPERPSLVVSGINAGANLSFDTYYSGTVAAAREAAMQGLPALSVSLFLDFGKGPSRPPPHWETAAHVAVQVVERLLVEPMPDGVFLNLNVPDLPLSALRGLRVVQLGRRTWQPRVVEHVDPWGAPYVWIGGLHEGFGQIPDSDGPCLAEGWATLTPIQLDNTARHVLGPLQAWSSLVPTESP